MLRILVCSPDGKCWPQIKNYQERLNGINDTSGETGYNYNSIILLLWIAIELETIIKFQKKQCQQS